jgi:hypothetical protein
MTTDYVGAATTPNLTTQQAAAFIQATTAIQNTAAANGSGGLLQKSALGATVLGGPGTTPQSTATIAPTAQTQLTSAQQGQVTSYKGINPYDSVQNFCTVLYPGSTPNPTGKYQVAPGVFDSGPTCDMAGGSFPALLAPSALVAPRIYFQSVLCGGTIDAKGGGAQAICLTGFVTDGKFYPRINAPASASPTPPGEIYQGLGAWIPTTSLTSPTYFENAWGGPAWPGNGFLPPCEVGQAGASCINTESQVWNALQAIGAAALSTVPGVGPYLSLAAGLSAAAENQLLQANLNTQPVTDTACPVIGAGQGISYF